MTDVQRVTFRPRRTRTVAIIAAVAVVLLFAVIGTALTTVGHGVFRTGDQAAMVGLGVVFGLGILALARPRVEADAAAIRVRNIVGGYELPWGAVRSIRLERNQPWLSLELENDDTVSVLAVQAVDKKHALYAVQELRRLHAAARTA
ncbi:PH domain-containing protein [Catellatospora sp. KI3]|uniref:PH domain-containing protein n=1 Tax=Catellatospora sp. KI3 TaxID=3041620 RepID=UPI00248274DE|nr:PH domain-containing protein [Catellatospora sp. KI3]MDI1462269.1 PH domain-containing protein [Catellatospora sp. KI3]